MNTNWAKILLFSLIGFALGFLVCRTTCGGRNGHEACMQGASCSSGRSCGHHDEKASCCGIGGDRGHAKGAHDGEHAGDAEADAIAKRLEEANFIGDTTISIPGGVVRVVRSADNTSVHVDMHNVEQTEPNQEH